MKLVQAFSIVSVGVMAALAGFAVPEQNRLKDAASPARVAVAELDFAGLQRLVKRDPAKPRPLLINFWATWCDPCREEFPDLVKIDSDFRAKGLEFVAISLDDKQELSTGVPRFLRQMRARMPAYLLSVDDPSPSITFIDAQWSGALPATFLYDAEGKVVYKRFGRVRVPELRIAIRNALKKTQ
jgi:thiol-disulfide isomerase/thioredoxin